LSFGTLAMMGCPRGSPTKSSARLSDPPTLPSAQENNMMIVTIPSNVDWKQVGKRMRVLYQVEFASADNQIVSQKTGTCWDDNLSQCADQILKAGKIAAHKVH
jgi:hypothetical protein